MKPVIIEMLKEYLESRKYDGLYNRTKECSCANDDLLACCDSANDCVAARKVPCDCTEQCDFHLKQADECPTVN
jgi:hypothetical protein